MKDLRDIQNHNLRRLLGEFLFSDDVNYWKASSRRKFHPDIKAKLEKYLEKHLSMQLMPTIIGQKELEDSLTSMLEGLLNKRKKRG